MRFRYLVAAALLSAGCSEKDDSLPARLELPGSAFYPTTIAAAADGTLFVSGAGTGEVVSFGPGKTEAEILVPTSSPQVVVPGIAFDEGSQSLYVCAVVFGAPNFSQPESELRRYGLDGQLEQAYPLPDQGSSICEDIAVDASQNVYVTDAFLGRVYLLRSGSAALEIWAADDLLKPGSNPVPPFGAHGITHDGNGNVYVSNFNTSALLRIPVEVDGSAGIVTVVTVTPPITNLEALRTLDETHLIVVEDIWASPNGKLTELTLGAGDTATSRVIRDGLAGPTSVIVSQNSYWITEGQISTLVSQTPPNLPFLIQRQPR